jgi:iron complex transport system substrate-binding protein
VKNKRVLRTFIQNFRIIVAATLVSAATAVAAQASTVSIAHAGGQTDVPSKPQRTVVLDLALLDVMNALEIPVAAVPEGRFSDALAHYRQDSVTKVGSMFEPDLDKIRALGPDLIIAGRRSTKAYPAVAGIAPAINLAFDQRNLVDSVMQTTRTLASLYGKQDVAKPLLERLDTSVKKLQRKAAKAGKGLLVFTTGGKLISQGPDSRFGVLFNGFGIQPAMTDFPDGKGVVLTAESLQVLDPDWIYVIDRDASLGRNDSSAKQMLDDAQVEKTAAGKNNRVVYLDPYNWYMLDGAGLNSLQENVDSLLTALER